jgi:protein-disulfide isomerase
VLVAAAVGAGIGWIARDSNAQDGDMVSVAPDGTAPAASAGAAVAAAACVTWAERICQDAGAKSEGCKVARDASQFLTGAVCKAAMAEVAQTLEKAKQLRSDCDALVAKLCKDIGEQTETCTMVKERTPSFPRAQCRQMLSNYDRVLGELQQMEKANAPLSTELAAKHAAGDAPAFGPDDAKVTLVEYSDFQCPFCSKAAKVVGQIKKRYGSVVRFVFRQYPLPNHPAAMPAAQASLAANAQGKFWAYHDLLFENSRELDREHLEEYAKKVGLDMAAFRKALDDKTYEKAVENDMELGKEVGIQGTPSLFVGTKRVGNPTDFEAVSKLIEAELTAAGVEIPKE